MVRTLVTFTALVLGSLLILVGIFSIYVGVPHPELCTLGGGLISATFALTVASNGNGKK